MLALKTLATLTAVTAVGAYMTKGLWSSGGDDKHSAFDEMECAPGGTNPIRNAGPDAMHSKPKQWDTVDDASDASFPASDPPSTY